jgi:large subunit ribosomal protein L4
VQATIYNLQGEALDTVELNDAIYGIEPNIGVVHQAVLRQQANARLGTHNTLTRGEVRGGGRKPWRQKGTGRARQGSTRSPQWRHGGVVFGPHPRSYVQDMPRKMRRLAMRSVLSAKAADGRILILDSFEALEPRTKAMLALIDTLQLGERRVLIMTPQRVQNLELAAGNLAHVTLLRTHFLSLVAMLKADVLVLDRASLEVIDSILGQTGGRASRPLTAEPAEDAAPRRMTSYLDAVNGADAAPAAGPVLEAPAVATGLAAPATVTEVVAPAAATAVDAPVITAPAVEPSGGSATVHSSVTVTPSDAGDEETS